MKPAVEWLNEIGHAMAKSMFAGKAPPGIEVEKVIVRIQVDALRHAARLVHDMSRGTKSEERAVAIDEARDLIAHEAELKLR